VLNGNRIVACVNALAGLNPEAIPDVVSELEKAHIIIRNALNLMTLEQKIEWGQTNERMGLINDGDTRAHEREAAIAKARQS
jgi:hypothetical protein